VLAPVLTHVRFVTGLQLRQLGLLVGRQNLHNLGPDASVRDFHLDHGLRVLRGQGARLCFVERAARLKRFHGFVF